MAVHTQTPRCNMHVLPTKHNRNAEQGRKCLPGGRVTTCFELLLAFTVGPTFQHATKRCFLLPSEAEQCDRLRCKALNRRKLEPNIMPPKWDFNGSFYVHKCIFLSPDHEHHEFIPPSQQTSIFPTSVASRYCPTINFVAVNRSSHHHHPIGETRINLQSSRDPSESTPPKKKTKMTIKIHSF